MPKPELLMVKYGRCQLCGVTAFLWARSPRARVKRCLVCHDGKQRKDHHESQTTNQ